MLQWVDIYNMNIFFLFLTLHFTTSKQLELLLFHSNNIYTHFEESEKHTGGAGRALHILTKARKRASERIGPPVLYLNAGDNFGGPNLYHEHKWRIVADFLNALKPDVMCLGNHDFDEGPKNLTKFLRRITFPIIGANVDVRKEKKILGFVKPYHLLTIGNWTIGVVGYTTRRAKITSRPGKIEFTDEVEAVQRESVKLRRMGVQIIIALGHAGINVDERIAQVAKDVDVVVGAHRKSWSLDVRHVKNYPPQALLRRDGKKVLILYEPGYLEFLGMVKIKFDEDGDVETYTGQPIYLHSKIPESDAINLIRSRRKREDMTVVLGRTKASLTGSCMWQECNMGNVLLDALVDHLATKSRTKKSKGGPWTYYPIAIINGGTFRKTLNITVTGKYITERQMLDAIPFDDIVCTFDIMGRYLLQGLEQAVTWSKTSKGELLQISGLHVTYNISREPGDRISRIFARCSECRIPQYQRLKADQMYGVVTTYYVAEGLSGHTGISKNKRNYIKRNAEIHTIFKSYLRKYKIVFADIEDRIVMRGESWRIEAEIIFLSCVAVEVIRLFLIG